MQVDVESRCYFGSLLGAFARELLMSKMCGTSQARHFEHLLQHPLVQSCILKSFLLFWKEAKKMGDGMSSSYRSFDFLA